MIGEKFNMLTVLEELPERKHGSRVYRCKCDCGNIKDVRKDMLKNGHVKSCGCLHTKHGKRETKIYHIFSEIKQRCYNKNNKSYNNYGGRGIIVCQEWLNDFMNFYNWAMNNNYQEGLTIDRIDNDGNYEPNNCRWADRKTQNNNRRNNTSISYNGKTQTLAQWSEELNVDQHTISLRKRKGWSNKECLFGRGENNKKCEI